MLLLSLPLSETATRGARSGGPCGFQRTVGRGTLARRLRPKWRPRWRKNWGRETRISFWDVVVSSLWGHAEISGSNNFNASVVFHVVGYLECTDDTLGVFEPRWFNLIQMNLKLGDFSAKFIYNDFQ